MQSGPTAAVVVLHIDTYPPSGIKNRRHGVGPAQPAPDVSTTPRILATPDAPRPRIVTTERNIPNVRRFRAAVVTHPSIKLPDDAMKWVPDKSAIYSLAEDRDPITRGKFATRSPPSGAGEANALKLATALATASGRLGVPVQKRRPSRKAHMTHTQPRSA